MEGKDCAAANSLVQKQYSSH